MLMLEQEEGLKSMTSVSTLKKIRRKSKLILMKVKMRKNKYQSGNQERKQKNREKSMKAEAGSLRSVKLISL